METMEMKSPRPTPALHRTAGAAGELPRRYAPQEEGQIAMWFSFEVGEHQKHIVEFSRDPCSGSLRVAVDGATLFERGFQLTSSIGEHPTDPVWHFAGIPIQLLQKWEFDVGSVEKHRVRIEKLRPKFLAGFRPHSYRALVDGRVVLERKGF